MPYTPPAGDALDLAIPAAAYAAPEGDALDLDLSAASGTTETGEPSLALRVLVITPAQIWDKPALGLTIAVHATGQPELDLVVAVASPSGQPELGLSIAVHATGQPELDLAIGVVDAQFVTTWRPAVRVGGVDISARLVGQISVEAEEGGARVAGFSFAPFAGALSPLAWNGQAVEIDLVRIIGAVEVASRLFTGVVDLPAYDVGTRLVRVNCTDDLANRIKALDQSALATLCGGGYHVALHGDAADLDGWAYAQARLTTVPGHIGADRYGSLWTVNWQDAPTRMSLTAASVLSETVRLDGLNRRAELVNRIRARLQWRGERLRLRKVRINYNHPAEYRTELRIPPPTLGDLLDTDGLDGWDLHVDHVEYAPDIHVSVVDGAETTNYVIVDERLGIDDQYVSRATLTYSRRWTQTVTDVYDLTIQAPASIASNGATSGEITAAWGSEWDAGAWESFESDTPAVTLSAPSGEAALDYRPDEPAGGAQAAVAYLIAAAKKTILESHRKTRVLVAVPGLPAIDLDWGVALSVDGLEASGKVSGITHVMDCATGAVTTEIAIALSGIANADISVTETPDTAPDAATIPAAQVIPGNDQVLVTRIGNVQASTAAQVQTDTALGSGYYVNAKPQTTLYDVDAGTYLADYNALYSPEGGYAEEGFQVTLPAVDDAYRQPAEYTVAASYDVAIPVDTLTLTA